MRTSNELVTVFCLFLLPVGCGEFVPELKVSWGNQTGCSEWWDCGFPGWRANRNLILYSWKAFPKSLFTRLKAREHVEISVRTPLSYKADMPPDKAQA